MSSQFEGCSFLTNVREVCEKKENGLVYLQNLLLSDILNDFPTKVRDIYKGMDMIRSRLCHKKVLVVLDDVNKFDQLKALAGKNNWFGSGSRIIVTTRDESLLLSTYTECKIYRVEKLNYSESLRLFSHKAFKSTHPSKEYEKLSEQVIAYAGGLPLALEVLGSFLCGKNVNQWKSALDRLKEYPNKEIMKVLQISFDGLEETEKSIFLDIACFLNGFDKDNIIQIMDGCGFFPEIGIRVLIDKSLLHVDIDDKVWMHDLLQEMGKEIVREKSRNEPGTCSRIWDYDDLCHVLEHNMGTKVEAILCCPLEPKKLVCDFEAFSNMKKLRLLIIHNLVLEMRDGRTLNIEYLSKELRFLKWHEFPAKYLPSNFQRGGFVEWLSKRLWNNPIKPLNNLKTIDLSHSTNLRKFEDFRVVPNLEHVILQGCVNLVEIHPSITLLERLTVLNLKACSSLQNLPTSIGALKSLKVLNLQGCVSLTNLPEDLGMVPYLKQLILEDCRNLMEIPPSIRLLERLIILNLKGCVGLQNLPTSMGGLKSLKVLNLEGCVSLTNLPEDLGMVPYLEQLILEDCRSLVEIPPSIRLLERLIILNLKACVGLQNIPTSVGGLKSLKVLNLEGCVSLTNLPEDLGMVPYLEQLILEDCRNLVEIPPSIRLLERLIILNLKACVGLQNLPTCMGGLKSLKVLNLEGCVSLTNLPEDLGLLKSLEELNLRGISVEDRDLPSSMALLENLKTLSCSGGRQQDNMMNIIVGKGLSSSAGLFSLKKLELISCGLGNGAFPENFGCCLVSLEHLDLSNNDFSCQPVSLNKLSRLRNLYFSHCSNLKSLGPEFPPFLEDVSVDYCSSLDTLHDTLMNHIASSVAYITTCVGCLRLATRQGSERTAFTSLKKHLQNFPGDKFDILLPGNEIPSWFTYSSFEPCINFQLGPNWLNSKWMGFALSSCFLIPSPSYICRVTCKEISLHYILPSTEKDVLSAVGSPVGHLWLLYVPRWWFGAKWQNHNRSLLEFSFETIDLDGETWTDKYIRSCGVRLVYEQDIEDMYPISTNPIEYSFEG